MSRTRSGWRCASGLLALGVGACCCPASRAVVAEPPAARAVALPVPDAARTGEADSATRISMRNVWFHVGYGVTLRVRALRGEMFAERPGQPPVLGDPSSFGIRVAAAEVAVDTASLANLMNRYVFRYEGAPLRSLSFQTKGDRLAMRGILHKGVDIPFALTASVALTPEGLVRLHPTDMDICSIDGDGLMRALGIDLGDLLDLSKAKGLRVEGNDLLLDATAVLPPPAIHGRLTSVRVADGALVQTFGGAGSPDETLAGAPTPPDTTANYMFFRGGTIRFGKLYMVRADLQIVDGDGRDPFDFRIAEYDRQLVAGYSETLEDMGLIAVMPDFDDLPGRVTRPEVGPR